MEYKQGIFWWVLGGMMGCVCLTLVLCLTFALCFRGEFPAHGWSSVLKSVGDTLIPLLVYPLFLPITSVLLEVYQCIQEDGDGATFLYKDCREYCWSDIHTNFTICATVALCFYIPVAATLRPLWQTWLYDLHVIANPWFIMLKAEVSIILIVLSKTLQRTSLTLHSIVYLAVVAAWSASHFWKEAYNYQRANLWTKCLAFCLLWRAAIGLVYQFSGDMPNLPILYVLVVALGWSLIGLATLII